MFGCGWLFTSAPITTRSVDYVNYRRWTRKARLSRGRMSCRLMLTLEFCDFSAQLCRLMLALEVCDFSAQVANLLLCPVSRGRADVFLFDDDVFKRFCGVQFPARPSDGRVIHRGDKANGVRQRGDACSRAHCMLGVTRTQGRRAVIYASHSHDHKFVAFEVQRPARPSDGRVSQRGDTATGCGSAGMHALAPTAC